jgi:energy-coupling factor transporter ATP-binding protein EcfA2
VVTSAAVKSPWCLAEVAIALSRGSRLLPGRAESGVNHPLLGSAQYADLSVDSTAGRAGLVEALRRVDAVGGFGWPDDLSPFPGLRPFDVEQHRVFLGRVGETEELAELLRSSAKQAKAAMLLVIGPSGCGKSSLVRAGLLPVMAEEPGWLTLPPILPGADPVAALARELAAAARRSNLDWTVEHVYRVLDKRGLVGCADELLLAHPDGPLRRLLLVVDQCEDCTPLGHWQPPASHDPSRAAASTSTAWLWPVTAWRALPVVRSQICTCPPVSAEASQDPSAVTTNALTPRVSAASTSAACARTATNPSRSPTYSTNTCHHRPTGLKTRQNRASTKPGAIQFR